MRRGHDHAAEPLRAYRVGGEQRHQGGVDAAREGDADVAEAVLGDVVPQPQDQRPINLIEVGERLGERAGRSRREVADQQLLLELGGAGDQLAVGGR